MKKCVTSCKVDRDLTTLKSKTDQDVRSLRSELSSLKEDYADLQDKLDALSHSTSHKLAAQAAELTSREGQVDSLSAELRASHDAADAHSAEVLRLQSALDAQAAEQADLSRHDAEEASWSVLRAELTRQAEHSRQLEAAHTRAMSELGNLRERHTAIEVLREQNRALERRAAAADELRETVVRLEAEVQAARTERETWCVPHHPPSCSELSLTLTRT
jgi:mitotic spindle assembly checkpoint protein MAD1